eukprot:scaffold1220_cov259-Pinguiococcus_pyrenoidosus.AAC.101
MRCCEHWRSTRGGTRCATLLHGSSRDAPRAWQQDGPSISRDATHQNHISDTVSLRTCDMGEAPSGLRDAFQSPP